MKLRSYYIDYYRTYFAGLAPSTAQGYEGDYANHIDRAFGGWEMEDIRVRHINAWLAITTVPPELRPSQRVQAVFNSQQSGGFRGYVDPTGEFWVMCGAASCKNWGCLCSYDAQPTE